MTTEKPAIVSPIDGFRRTTEMERKLNELAAATFSTPAALDFLNYLKAITTNYVLGPGCGDGELRHLEGQRYVVSIMNRRAELGRKPEPAEPHGSGRGTIHSRRRNPASGTA